MHISILSCCLVQHLSSRFRTSRKDSRQAGMTDNVVLLMNSLVKVLNNIMVSFQFLTLNCLVICTEQKPHPLSLMQGLPLKGQGQSPDNFFSQKLFLYQSMQEQMSPQ